MPARTTNTLGLIQAAEAALAADQKAAQDLSLAQTIKTQTASALVAANQALHDDLSANGPAVVVDDTSEPPVVTMYTAVDPSTYKAEEIRVAA